MIEQGTPEWFAQRCGKVTASRIGDLTAQTKSGWGASRKNYMAELLAERLTGQTAASFSSAAMQWGTDTEPQARSVYEFMCNVEVTPAEFVTHPKIKESGASPDGFVGEIGLIEIKCPNTATHLDSLLGSAIEKKYMQQMQWQMACTGREWCDFVSFDPRLPETYQILIQRVERDKSLIVELEGFVREFLVELDAKEAKLRERFDPPRNVLLAG